MAAQTLGKKIGSSSESIKLSKLDRCDACGAQAYVLVQGTTGTLMFCGHHYTSIMNSPTGKLAMDSFAFNTVDDRDSLLSQKAGS
jgi:hypothetical protein